MCIVGCGEKATRQRAGGSDPSFPLRLRDGSSADQHLLLLLLLLLLPPHLYGPHDFPHNEIFTGHWFPEKWWGSVNCFSASNFLPLQTALLVVLTVISAGGRLDRSASVTLVRQSQSLAPLPLFYFLPPFLLLFYLALFFTRRFLSSFLSLCVCVCVCVCVCTPAAFQLQVSWINRATVGLGFFFPFHISPSLYFFFFLFLFPAELVNSIQRISSFSCYCVKKKKKKKNSWLSFF